MDQKTLAMVVRRCCEIKAQVVAQDEKESGLRAILNYGHTLGHALETLAGYREMVHGEAVAVGMVLAARISVALGHCTADDAVRIERLLTQFGLSLSPPTVDRDRLMDALLKDKKSRSGSISFICNRGIGAYVIEKSLPEQLLAMSGLEV
jgi:3-dehydroquinate synthase